jgi:aminoglycoside 6'-N-acetyltransferase
VIYDFRPMTADQIVGDTDPHPQNTRAIRAYEKAGFAAYGEIISPGWGPSLLMQCSKS